MTLFTGVGEVITSDSDVSHGFLEEIDEDWDVPLSPPSGGIQEGDTLFVAVWYSKKYNSASVGVLVPGFGEISTRSSHSEVLVTRDRLATGTSCQLSIFRRTATGTSDDVPTPRWFSGLLGGSGFVQVHGAAVMFGARGELLTPNSLTHHRQSGRQGHESVALAPRAPIATMKNLFSFSCAVNTTASDGSNRSTPYHPVFLETESLPDVSPNGYTEVVAFKGWDAGAHTGFFGYDPIPYGGGGFDPDGVWHEWTPIPPPEGGDPLITTPDVLYPVGDYVYEPNVSDGDHFVNVWYRMGEAGWEGPYPTLELGDARIATPSFKLLVREAEEEEETTLLQCPTWNNRNGDGASEKMAITCVWYDPTYGSGTPSGDTATGWSVGSINTGGANQATAPEETSRSIRFNYTGRLQYWTCPDDVSEVTIRAIGARGGPGISAAPGGGLELVQGLEVTPGEVYEIAVGEQGRMGESPWGGWSGRENSRPGDLGYDPGYQYYGRPAGDLYAGSGGGATVFARRLVDPVPVDPGPGVSGQIEVLVVASAGGGGGVAEAGGDASSSTPSETRAKAEGGSSSSGGRGGISLTTAAPPEFVPSGFGRYTEWLNSGSWPGDVGPTNRTGNGSLTISWQKGRYPRWRIEGAPTDLGMGGPRP